ncbi:MAG: nickel pincer cofactor biosynthesis protein LarC [Acidobacteria bacterium]|nr:MAG: nickel pincer cofactor biosynthesis protein LarC [Acidobacteriota bacterium]
MRAVYFDCFAGVSGDMIIGALIDLGVDLEALKQQLSSLGLDQYEISSRRVQRSSIAGTKFEVEVDQSAQPVRTLKDISSIIAGSSLSDLSKTRAIRVFERLAEAEAIVHETTPDKVHFHEVGAVDSIVDITGAMIGFELLGIERFFCSALRVGSGFVETQHGRLPVPAPATAELLRGIPVYAGEIEGEFVTPTGAAIVATLCEAFGPMPQMNVTAIGYGAGSRDPKGFPNALRLMLGEMEEPKIAVDRISEIAGRGKAASSVEKTIVVVETNIDDMNPQVYGFVMERAFVLGALDVFMVNAQMKKDRPGVLLTVLCKPEKVEAMIEMLLLETTTLGVRYYEAKRRVLERSIEAVETPYGLVRIKVARDGERTLHFQPEYDDCARLAVETNTPLLEVQAAATAAYRKLKQL